MDKIITIVTKPAKMIAMILLFAAAGFGLIVNASDLGGGFMPVVGGLLFLLFDLVIWASIPTLYALKKDYLVKYALAIVLGYWAISFIYSGLQGAFVATKGYAGLTIASGLFRFFIALILLGCAAMLILYVIKKDKKFLQISVCAFAGSLLFFFVLWAIRLAAYVEWEYDWADYFDLFRTCLFAPIGLVFAVFATCMEQRAD